MDVAVKPVGCTNLKLRQLSRRVARRYESELRDLGLKNTQYSLLSCVVKLGPMTQAALAEVIGLDPSTLTRNLQPMVARGWLLIEAGDDARSHRVSATPGGRELREQAQRAWKRSQLALNERLGAARVARLHALVDECTALLADDGPGDARNA